MSELIQKQVTRKELEAITGFKGKKLSEYLRSEKKSGSMVSVMRHTNPSANNKREKVYCVVARQDNLALA